MTDKLTDVPKCESEHKRPTRARWCAYRLVQGMCWHYCGKHIWPNLWGDLKQRPIEECRRAR